MNLHSSDIVSSLALLFTAFCFGYGAMEFAKQSAWVTTAVFILCAIGAGAWGVAILIRTLTQPSDRDREALKHRGQKILTTFKALDRRWNVQRNGQSPIVIYTQGTDPTTGRLCTFESEELWLSADDIAMHGTPLFRAWQTLEHADPSKTYLIPVYLDPLDSKKYTVNLEELLESD